MTAFDNIRLEKGLYASGDFTGALEKIDPSENYSGTALEGLDAYQRQLKRFNIKATLLTSSSRPPIPPCSFPSMSPAPSGRVCRRRMSSRA